MDEHQALCLKALILCAEKLPKAALPHMGPLAVRGIALEDDRSRHHYFDALSCLIGGHGPHAQQEGRKHLLHLKEADARNSVIENIELLRLATKSPEHSIIAHRFFTHLKEAEVLRYHHQYVLYPDGFEADEDAMQSLYDGTAFLEGGLVSRLLKGDATPVVRKRNTGRPGRNADIETFLVTFGVPPTKEWKEVLHAAKAQFGARIKSLGQLRKLWSRYIERQNL